MRVVDLIHILWYYVFIWNEPFGGGGNEDFVEVPWSLSVSREVSRCGDYSGHSVLVFFFGIFGTEDLPINLHHCRRNSDSSSCDVCFDMVMTFAVAWSVAWLLTASDRVKALHEILRGFWLFMTTEKKLLYGYDLRNVEWITRAVWSQVTNSLLS